MSDADDFMAFTGCSTRVEAEGWLDMYSNHMTSAVEAYYAMNGGSASIDGAGQKRQAERMGEVDADGVRLPDRTKKMTLLAPDNGPSGGYYHDFNESMRPKQRKDDAISFISSKKPENEKEIRLNTIFAPPHAIMSHDNFEKLREEGRKDDKWILVNIQNEDFECHKLNRDVWKDEIIQQIVQCYFLFWQQRFNSEYGEQFCHMYKIKETELPYIAIIDPRTGITRWTQTGGIKCQNLGDKLSDFIGQFESPYASSSSSAYAGRSSSDAPPAPSTSTKSASKDNIVDLIGESPQQQEKKKPVDESATHLKFTPSTLIAKYLSVDAQNITASGDSTLRENLLNGVKDFISKKFERKLVEEKSVTELTDLTDDAHTFFQSTVLTLSSSSNDTARVTVTLLASMNINQSLKRISMSFPIDTPLVFIALVISLHLEDQQYMDKSFDVYTTHPRKGFCEWLREGATASSIYSFGTTLATIGITCNTKLVVEFTQ